MTDADDGTTETHNIESKDDLVELYHGQNLSMQEIADKAGCSISKVRYWMDKRNVARRNRAEAKLIEGGAPSMSVDTGGYENFTVSQGGEKSRVDVHRLTAVVKHGFSALDGKHVHHKNGVPWDNRPGNLEVLTPKEHVEKHHGKPDSIKLAVWSLYESSEMTYKEIAELFDEPQTNISSFIKYVRDGKTAPEVEG